MGGPNPGIVANFVVEKIERDTLTFRVPRYCAINSDGSLYFVSGQKYVAHVMDEDSGRRGARVPLPRLQLPFGNSAAKTDS